MGGIAFGRQRSAAFALCIQVYCTHQSSYTLARDLPPLIFQFPVNSRGPISPLMLIKDLPNLLCQLSIFSGALAGRALAPGVKATF